MPRRQPTPGPGDYQPEIWTGAPIKKGPHPPINVTDYKGPQNATKRSGLSSSIVTSARSRTSTESPRWPDALQYELPKRSSRKPPPFEVGYGDSRATGRVWENKLGRNSELRASSPRAIMPMSRPPTATISKQAGDRAEARAVVDAVLAEAEASAHDGSSRMTARELAAVLGEMEALKSRLEMAEAANALLSAELEEVQEAAATKATVRAATSNSSDEVVELRAENRRLRQELAAAHHLTAKGREEEQPLTREDAPAAVVAVAESVDGIVPKPDRDQNVALTPGAEEVADEPEALDEAAIVEPRAREETHENEELSPYDPPAVALE